MDLSNKIENIETRLNNIITKLNKPPILRPNDFSEYIGQEKAKRILSDSIVSAQKRKTAVGHILLSSASPGVGKTTIANLVAEKMGVTYVSTVASALEDYEDIYNLFASVKGKPNPVIIIDEIHRLKHSLCESIYVAMEDPNSEFKTNKRFGAVTSPSFKMGPFTLIGLTAGSQGMLPKPFLDRFEIQVSLTKYTLNEITSIVEQSANKIGVKINENTARIIAERSIYTPRISNSILKRVRDYCVAHSIKTITLATLDKIFELMSIDNLGLNEMARSVLKALADSPRGNYGVNSLSAVTNIDAITLKNIIEPQLITHGLIVYMAKGRAITDKGIKHIEDTKK